MKKASPTHLDLIEMGKFYFLNGKLDQAKKEFDRAVEIKPSSADAFYNLGLVYESQNNLVSAQESYEKALSLDEKHALAKKHLNKLIGLEQE